MRMCERELMLAHQNKARSASICVSVESSTPPMSSRRRPRPAARSQSARSNNNNNRRNIIRQSNASAGSDTRLETAGLEGPLGRRGSTRRATMVMSSSGHWQHHQHRKSAAFLDVPDPPPPPLNSSSHPAHDPEDSLRIRSFSFNSKGTGIINRGDSFRKRRSRSNSLAGGTPPPQQQQQQQHQQQQQQQQEASSVLEERASGEVSPECPTTYRVMMLGSPGVGKTALVSQFMTSECINAYDRQKDEPCQQSVYVMLNGEESEMKFITEPTEEGVDKNDAFVVMYSVIDKASFQKAESELSRLQRTQQLRSKAAILVANKIDLVRSRAVSPQDGKCVACTYGAKFIEVSVGINHNVDELLVGILTQIRLKEESVAADNNGTSSTSSGSSRHWYNNHGVLRASMKARQMFTWIFGKEDSKFKNCENLHIL